MLRVNSPLLFTLDDKDKIMYYHSCQWNPFLPTASEGRGKVMFSVCSQVEGVPTPPPPAKIPTPHPGQDVGGGYPKVPTPSQGTYPLSRSGQGGTPKYLPPSQGTYPHWPRYLPAVQVRMGRGGTPRYLPPAKVPTPLAPPPPNPGQDRGGSRGYPKVPTPGQGTYPPSRLGWGRGYPKVPIPPPLPG